MRLSRLVAAASVVLSALTTAVVMAAPPASAAITDGAVFNNPFVAAEQYKIRDHVRTLINATLTGETIRIAMYHFRDTTVAADLIAAKDRGVNVRLVVDYSDATQAAVQNLVAKLGSDRTQASWLVLCTKDAACIGNKAPSPIMHNKFFLFTKTSGSTNVVVQSSANLTVDNATKYWNNAVTLAGNTGLYNAYVKYHTDLAAKAKNNDYYTTVGSGNAKVYFFPRAGTDESTDTVYNMLNENITCEGNSTVGTQDTHRTIIRIGMWYFSRDDIARKLRELADKKCWVDVIYSNIDAGSKGHLINHPRIALYTYPDTDGAYIIHSKYMLIEGTYAGEKDTKWVVTGSHNYTTSALRENDETMLRIKSNAIHDQYRDNFRAARALADTVEPSAAE